jgi:hypothetical protein
MDWGNLFWAVLYWGILFWAAKGYSGLGCRAHFLPPVCFYKITGFKKGNKNIFMHNSLLAFYS